MADEIMIPILPCHSVNDMFEFYTALGFEITYRQEKPNVYGAVQRGGIQLHFFSMRGYDPAQSYSTCLVLVPDAEALRQAFVEGLRAHYGKLPASGIPRITRRDRSGRELDTDHPTHIRQRENRRSNVAVIESGTGCGDTR
jgi:hypothetical protein